VSEASGRPGARRLWTAYVAAITLFVVVGEARNLAVDGLPGLAALANWALTAALLTAAWGYALRRPLGAASYWRVVFWIVLAATAVMLVPVAMTSMVVKAYTGALLLLVAPAFVAAYRYAYRSPELWPRPRG
jgi:O-antigen ligase